MVKSKNLKLWEEAKEYIAGGVNSPVRSFKYVDIPPIFVKKGKGSFIFDVDNKKYIDFIMGWGSLILGHSPDILKKKMKDIIENGWYFGLNNEIEVKYAKTLKKIYTFVDKFRFTNSGTEAVMSAIRLARAFTGKNKIIKFDGFYHGHVDYLLVKGGSGLLTFSIPYSKGVSENFIKDTIILPFNNFEVFEKTVEKYKDEIACVITEPVGANNGLVLPEKDFLSFIRKITEKYGIILIFDEIITGFRLSIGGACEYFKIIPDLICLGKIAGGGLPIGIFGGKNEIMKNLAPEGDVYQAGTFSGNCLSMIAGETLIKYLFEKKEKIYPELEKNTMVIVENIRNMVKNNNVEILNIASIFYLKFSDISTYKKFFIYLFKNGILFPPSPFEVCFISTEHKEKEIDKLLFLVNNFFKKELK